MQLPTELVEEILLQCVYSGDRAACRNLRLTCRLFDRVLKPHVCRTINFSWRQLDRSGIRRLPSFDALDTIGKVAKVLNIDLSVVRDQSEVDMIEKLVADTPPDPEWAWRGITRCLMDDDTCTEERLRSNIGTTLRRCNDIRTLRLVLPTPIVPTPCDIPTRIFANTMAAFAWTYRDTAVEGAEPLIHLPETLVIENLTEQVLWDTFRNPIDLGVLRAALKDVRHLVMCLRDPDYVVDTRPGHVMRTYTRDFWSFISTTGATIESLCISYADLSPRTNRGPRIPRPSMRLKSFNRAQERYLPIPSPPLHGPSSPMRDLTRLELKNVSIDAAVFLRYLYRCVALTLRELYLDRVDMEINDYADMRLLERRQTYAHNLWIGVPNRRPHSVPMGHELQPDERYPEWWAAVLLRDKCRNLQIVRATELCYVSAEPFYRPGAYDIVDPSGLGRTIAQRFVEVVLGYEQPDAPPNPLATPNVVDLDTGGPTETISTVHGGPVRYLPYKPEHDERYANGFYPRPPGGFRAEDHDLEAFRLAGHPNNTSGWLHSVDGNFPNVPSATDDAALDKWVDECHETLRYTVEKVPRPFEEWREYYHHLEALKLQESGRPARDIPQNTSHMVGMNEEIAHWLIHPLPLLDGDPDAEDEGGEWDEEDGEDSAMLEQDQDQEAGGDHDPEGPVEDGSALHEQDDAARPVVDDDSVRGQQPAGDESAAQSEGSTAGR